jgi:hypothetical protein
MEWPKAKVGEVQGRNDLWMSSAAWSWCIEAKMGWMGPNETGEANHLLAMACVDAQRIRGLRDYKSLVGVALGCLHSFVQHEDILDQQLSQTIGALQLLEYDALAWCFPPSIRRLRDGNRLYPGLMLLARVVEVEADEESGGNTLAEQPSGADG